MQMWKSFRISLWIINFFDSLVSNNASLFSAIAAEGSLIRGSFLNSDEHFSSELLCPLVIYLVFCLKPAPSPRALWLLPQHSLGVPLYSQLGSLFPMQMSQLFGLPLSIGPIHVLQGNATLTFHTTMDLALYFYIFMLFQARIIC